MYDRFVDARQEKSTARLAAAILDLCVEQGLLLLQAGPDVLRFVPALNIDDADVAEGLARLGAALRAFASA